MSDDLPDAAAREQITGALDRTLFVEAAPAAGKPARWWTAW